MNEQIIMEQEITNYAISAEVCAECGSKMDDKHESYMMKCDRCLSKENE